MNDLEKAFDLVWHKGVVYKMEQVGLHGNVLKFVVDLSKDRLIQVGVGAALSIT